MERSVAIEDYVRAIYQLQQQEKRGATTALARRMKVAPASATGMLKRLHGLRLVTHEPYAGVVLTSPSRATTSGSGRSARRNTTSSWPRSAASGTRCRTSSTL